MKNKINKTKKLSVNKVVFDFDTVINCLSKSEVKDMTITLTKVKRNLIKLNRDIKHRITVLKECIKLIEADLSGNQYSSKLYGEITQDEILKINELDKEREANNISEIDYCLDELGECYKETKSLNESKKVIDEQLYYVNINLCTLKKASIEFEYRKLAA